MTFARTSLVIGLLLALSACSSPEPHDRPDCPPHAVQKDDKDKDKDGGMGGTGRSACPDRTNPDVMMKKPNAGK